MSSVSAQFDCQCKITPEASAHSTRDDVDDVKRVIDVVKREKLWLVHKGRKHRKFPTMSSDPLHNLDIKKLKDWMQN